MTYREVVESIACEVAPLLNKHRFDKAFDNAPSVSMLDGAEIAKAKRDVASRLGKSGGKKKRRHYHLAIR